MEHSSKPTFDQAIDLLTSDDAVANITRRIAHHENEATKLKKLLKALGKSSPRAKRTSKLDVELEGDIVDLITEHGPLEPKELGAMLEVHYMKIGKTVAASSKLSKDGTAVVLVAAQ